MTPRASNETPHRDQRMFDVDDRRHGDDRREDYGPQVQIRWSVVFQTVLWIVGLVTVYVTMTNRLTALETQRANDTQRMERIESKVDLLLEKGR